MSTTILAVATTALIPGAEVKKPHRARAGGSLSTPLPAPVPSRRGAGLPATQTR
jgi:hypothetical protein